MSRSLRCPHCHGFLISSSIMVTGNGFLISTGCLTSTAYWTPLHDSTIVHCSQILICSDFWNFGLKWLFEQIDCLDLTDYCRDFLFNEVWSVLKFVSFCFVLKLISTEIFVGNIICLYRNICWINICILCLRLKLGLHIWFFIISGIGVTNYSSSVIF